MKRFIFPLCTICAILLSCEKIDSGTHPKEVDDVCEQMEDLAFMKYCYDHFDVNKDGKVSMTEAAAATIIELYDADIISMQGIEYFTGIKELYCDGTFSSLDLSNCRYLEKLEVISTGLASLDLKNCLSLKHLYCGYSELKSIKIVDYSQLEYFCCEYSPKLTQLSVKDCPVLSHLSGQHCDILTDIEITNCGNINYFNFCRCENLSRITAKNCAIESFDASAGWFEENWRARPSYDYFGPTLRYNTLAILDFSGSHIEDLDVSFSGLTELNLKGCSGIKKLDCTRTAIKNLDVSSCDDLEMLSYWPADNKAFFSNSTLIVSANQLSRYRSIWDVSDSCNWVVK